MKSVGPSEVALSSIFLLFCFPLIVVVFSPYVLSFSWLYVSFSSHFHLLFCSLFFFSSFFVVLIHVIHFLCIHFGCSLALYLLLLVLYLFFPTSSSYSSSPSFFCLYTVPTHRISEAIEATH